MSYSEKMQKVLEKICIPDASEIRGNITLPEELGEARISWKSSDAAVITDKDQGKLKAGVVTRGQKEKKVLLTATIALGEETAEKKIEVTVLQAPEPIEEEDYEGYLFGHFIGEGSDKGEQIYFAISEDGLNFKDMNDGRPVLVSDVGEKGVRDPYLYRSHEGDRYFLVATDLSIFHRGGWLQNEQGYCDASTTGSRYLILWESTDLVHWKEPKMMDVAPENAGMAWAPEMIYDDETGEYIIFFASSIMNSATKHKVKPNAIYYVATRDFVHFSDTRIFIDNQIDGEKNGMEREIIDTTVLKVGDVYYSASKDGGNDEENGGIRIMKTKSLLDPDSWKKVLDLDELGLDISGLSIRGLNNGDLEGPELFQYNKKDWADPAVPEYGIMADQYMVDGGYLPLKTTDMEDAKNERKSWKLLASDEYSFDQLKKRHGTIFRITKKELQALKQAFM